MWKCIHQVANARWTAVFVLKKAIVLVANLLTRPVYVLIVIAKLNAATKVNLQMIQVLFFQNSACFVEHCSMNRIYFDFSTFDFLWKKKKKSGKKLHIEKKEILVKFDLFELKKIGFPII